MHCKFAAMIQHAQQPSSMAAWPHSTLRGSRPAAPTAADMPWCNGFQQLYTFTTPDSPFCVLDSKLLQRCAFHSDCPHALYCAFCRQSKQVAWGAKAPTLSTHPLFQEVDIFSHKRCCVAILHTCTCATKAMMHGTDWPDGITAMHSMETGEHVNRGKQCVRSQ